MPASLLQRCLDLIAPRFCCACGERLTAEEDLICLCCNLHMPRTDHYQHADDNAMVRMFWGRVKAVDRAGAWIRHYSKLQSIQAVYQMKYFDRPELGLALGELIAKEMAREGFLDDVEAIVPVPLAPDRLRHRGYNQSEWLAQGIAYETGLKIEQKLLRRQAFKGSQTSKDRWGRNANVALSFFVNHGERMKGKRVLLLDDVMTTGATLCAAAKALEAIEDIRITAATVSFADTR